MGLTSIQGSLEHRLQAVVVCNNFSIKKMYGNLYPLKPKVPWKNLLLHPTIHPRHKFILWLGVLNRLATVDRLLKVGVQVPHSCVFCKGPDETMEHLFFGCPITHTFWRRALVWIGEHRTVGSWQEELDWINNLPKKRSGKEGILCCLFAMVINIIWRERNMMRFQNGIFQPEKVCKELAMFIHIRGREIKQWQPYLHQLVLWP
ncbi:uncharacterized protein LOC132045723 [Lycium ferocissimum]|uniref:uncharacterized protein LOC132045723 n=1 Tax=Lycium ferocissimum TaxID=112874 RepID=UPI0028160BFA|nr:uncharacterized protein LOC132045723 [Lycium ferocissimum]